MPPILESKRMHLRPPRADDYEHIYRLGSSKAVMKYINGGIPQNRQEAKKDLEKRLKTANMPLGYWIAELKDQGDFLGWMCLKQLDNSPHIEIGYRFLEEYWGQGLATEGGQVILEYAFQQLKLERVLAVALEENQASTRVMEKLGLEKEGYDQYYGVDVVVYRISREDYLKTKH
ncbi:MAG: GNAT family N-acetyltransferase [Saprospiraceae bacterium]|nr:GNAT family N-acetyltransferase [Saprospiraceae bacterium]